MALENVLPAGADTLLTISGLGGFQYQARGLSQTLTHIKEASDMMRTINATLRDVSNPIFRKYSTKITCTDINAPPLDGLWPGMEIEVECAASLSFLTGTAGSPGRPVASGSLWTLGNYTFYRPVMNMLVINFEEDFDEWKSDVKWMLEAEEV